jgi:hypothetical protein
MKTSLTQPEILLERAAGLAPGLALLLGATLFLTGCSTDIPSRPGVIRTQETPTVETEAPKPRVPRRWNVEFAAAIGAAIAGRNELRIQAVAMPVMTYQEAR